MSIITDVEPVTAFIGGESLPVLLERLRATDAAQWQLLADANINLLGEYRETDRLRKALAEAQEALEAERQELERLRQELAAVRAGRDRLYSDYCKLARHTEPVNIEEME